MYVFLNVFQIMKRNLNNVKRMTSHPMYQYCKYLCRAGRHRYTVESLIVSFPWQTWPVLRTVVWECLNGTGLSSSSASDKQAMLESPDFISTPRATRYTHSHTLTLAHRVHRLCYVYVMCFLWLLFVPLVVWSCWWGGFPQSLAGQPNILQPQTLPGEVTSQHPRLPKTLLQHTHTQNRKYLSLELNISFVFLTPVPVDRVGSVTLRHVEILPSSRPPASSPQPGSPMTTGQCQHWTSLQKWHYLTNTALLLLTEQLMFCLLCPQKRLPVGHSDIT